MSENVQQQSSQQAAAISNVSNEKSLTKSRSRKLQRASSILLRKKWMENDIDSDNELTEVSSSKAIRSLQFYGPKRGRSAVPKRKARRRRRRSKSGSKSGSASGSESGSNSGSYTDTKIFCKLCF